MPFDLAAHRDCFEGIMPAVIATVAADGTPNVTYLSKVVYLDGRHIALTNQFFTKTVANIRENPRAQLTLLEPTCGRQLRLSVRFVRSETSGELFEQLRAEVDAIASLMGKQDLFRLRSADVYLVNSGEVVASDLDG